MYYTKVNNYVVVSGAPEEAKRKLGKRVRRVVRHAGHVCRQEGPYNCSLAAANDAANSVAKGVGGNCQCQCRRSVLAQALEEETVYRQCQARLGLARRLQQATHRSSRCHVRKIVQGINVHQQLGLQQCNIHHCTARN